MKLLHLFVSLLFHGTLKGRGMEIVGLKFCISANLPSRTRKRKNSDFCFWLCLDSPTNEECGIFVSVCDTECEQGYVQTHKIIYSVCSQYPVDSLKNVDKNKGNSVCYKN